MAAVDNLKCPSQASAAVGAREPLDPGDGSPPYLGPIAGNEQYKQPGDGWPLGHRPSKAAPGGGRESRHDAVQDREQVFLRQPSLRLSASESCCAAPPPTFHQEDMNPRCLDGSF